MFLQMLFDGQQAKANQSKGREEMARHVIPPPSSDLRPAKRPLYISKRRFAGKWGAPDEKFFSDGSLARGAEGSQVSAQPGVGVPEQAVDAFG
ncbi:MAG TPA: hypothetical protein VGM03_18665 [Phycisphaerae bacterium]|jgi:hypothetical protein